MSKAKYDQWYRTQVAKFRSGQRRSVADMDRVAKRAKAGETRALVELTHLISSIAETAASKQGELARNRGIEFDDLRQEAMRAMLESLKRWSPEKVRGASFRTFAYEVARFAVMDLINNSHLVSIQKHLADDLSRGVERDIHKRYSSHSIMMAKAAIGSPLSIYPCTHVGDDNLRYKSERNTGPGVSEGDIPSHESEYQRIVNALALKQMFKRACLTPRQRESLEAKYGLNGKEVLGKKDSQRMAVLARQRGVGDQAIRNAAMVAEQKIRERNVPLEKRRTSRGGEEVA